MKKGLLLSLTVAFSISVMAQSAHRLPNGFRKAEVPASIKNRKSIESKKRIAVDNGIPDNNNASRRLVAPLPSRTYVSSFLDEYLVGKTYYDLQTNASISHRIVRNPQVGGEPAISLDWTQSLTYDAAEAFPNRGTGYNYSSDDGVTWLYPFVPGVSQGPTSRIENVRTGFTNITTTRSGAEMAIAHNGTGINVCRRSTTGSGAWASTTPFGNNTTDFWPKAVADGDTVYTIFQGSGTAGTIVNGQDGPMFFSVSTDGGVTWTPKTVIPEIDSTQYSGFGGDDYNIDARNGVVAIVVGGIGTDLILLKSSDLGQTWTKTLIVSSYFHDFDFAGSVPSDTNADGEADFVYTTFGDANVLLDNNGQANVWFSDYYFLFDSTVYGTSTFYINSAADGLEYWNESMPTNGFVLIATAQDFNGNDSLDVPVDSSCSTFRKWGNYRGGITCMPSAGIDANGTMYVTYQTVDESADTTLYLLSHYHVYMTTSSDGGLTWTYPYDVTLSQAEGGDGENQECVFASLARYVDSKACLVYQRDGAPGTALATANSCDDLNNSGNYSDIVFARIDALTVNTNNSSKNDLFVSQSYPNPTNGIARVNIGTKKAGDINFTVTDMLGKVVYSDIKSGVAAGTTTITLNTAAWSSGIYNYTVIAGDQKASKQMIVQ